MSVQPSSPHNYLIVYPTEVKADRESLEKLTKWWQGGIISGFQSGKTDFPMIPKGSIRVVGANSIDETIRKEAIRIINLGNKPSAPKRKQEEVVAEEIAAPKKRRKKKVTHLAIYRGESTLTDKELIKLAKNWRAGIIAGRKKNTLPPTIPAGALRVKEVTDLSKLNKDNVLTTLSLTSDSSD